VSIIYFYILREMLTDQAVFLELSFLEEPLKYVFISQGTPADGGGGE
jgi:hypothetical protein